MATEYNSFYGGRRGASFVIVKKYKTIKKPAEDNIGWNKIIRADLGLGDSDPISAEDREKWLKENCMVECFRQGGSYKVVNYDEYVIIDTVNKNDEDNGKIYRRGYDYNNELGGANYIGQIVGPAGMAPHVEMKTIAEVEEITKKDGLEAVDGKENEFVEKDEQGADKYYYRTSKGEYAPLENLIPGKYWDDNGKEQFNDDIQYMACSVKDSDSHETTVHIGFKIPFLVQEYTSETVSPYYHRSDLEPKDLTGDDKWNKWDENSSELFGNGTDNFNNLELIKRTDDIQHPFFARWNISIPKGIKGESFNNFRITTLEAEEERAAAEGANATILQNYPGMEDDKPTAEDKKRQILVYDYYDYDRDPSGDPVSLYLGDYNMIDNFQIDEDGTVTIDYSHDDRDIYPNLFKWIKSISLNKDTGLFTVIYNYDEESDSKEPTKYEINLTWVKDIQFQEDGTVKMIYTTSEDDRDYTNLIKWITNVNYTPETGLLEMDFNYPTNKDGTPTHWETNLRYIDNIRIDDNGTIHFDYTFGDEQTFEQYLKTIKNVSLNSDNGLFSVIYNTLDEDGNNESYETNLRWVNNIELAEDGTVTVGYTTEPEVILDNKIKWIKQIELLTDGTIEITYNDDTKDTFEQKIQWISSVKLDEDGTFTVKYNNNTPDYTTNIVWPASLSINTGDVEGTGNQKIKVTYNDGTEKDIGNPLNYIMKTAISEDYHLLFLHSDPVKRQSIIDAGENATYAGRDDWQDMGSVKDDDGVLIGKNLSVTDVPEMSEIDTAISYLNNHYPNGLIDPDLKGKIITCGKDAKNKFFYAFDYSKDEDGNYKGWYFLGSIESAAASFAGREDDTETIKYANEVPVNSLWFIIED